MKKTNNNLVYALTTNELIMTAVIYELLEVLSFLILIEYLNDMSVH